MVDLKNMYWLLLMTIALFLWRVPKIKQLSSYNIKWILIYIFYIVCLIVGNPTAFGLSVYSNPDGDIEYILISSILIPYFLYLITPTILRYIGKWKLVVLIDKIIDSIYTNIKDKSIK